MVGVKYTIAYSFFKSMLDDVPLLRSITFVVALIKAPTSFFAESYDFSINAIWRLCAFRFEKLTKDSNMPQFRKMFAAALL